MKEDLPVTGVWFDDGNIIERKTQDVEPFFENNKALYNAGDGYSPSRELRRAASIPMVVVEQWLSEGIDIFDPNHKEAVRRKLNDPENRFLRTAPGKL